MNFKKIIVIILYLIMTFIVSNCARNISFPKIEEGIFTGKMQNITIQGKLK